MSARSRIVDALQEVEVSPGVVLTAYDAEPDQKHDYAVWPVLREVTRDGVLCAPFTNTYDVFAVLPNAYAPATAAAAEELAPVLVGLLEPLGEWVQPAELVRIAFDDTTTVPGIRVQIIPDPEEES